MSSRTVKWLLLASVLLIAFPVAAGASTARVTGLGIQGDYIKDYTNIYTYLSNINSVGNVVYGDLGNWDSWDYTTDTEDRAVGAIIGNLFDGKFGTIGVRLSEETALLGQADADHSTSWDPNTNTSHAFDLMWGKKFGAMSLGLRVNRSYARIEGDPRIDANFNGVVDGFDPTLNEITGDFSRIWSGVWVDDELIQGEFDLNKLNYSRNILGFGGGIGYEVSEKLTLEASMLYQSRTFMAKDTLYDKSLYLQDPDDADGLSAPVSGQKWENDGSGAYLLALRALCQVKPDLLVMPVFKYFNIKADASNDRLVPTGLGYHTELGVPNLFADSLIGAEHLKYTTLEDNSSGWQIGIAGNWTLNQNDLFVLGATLASTKMTLAYSAVDSSWDRTSRQISYSDPYSYYESTYTETMMPAIFAALETHVNSWLTLRFGAQQGVFYTSKFERENFWRNSVTNVVTPVENSKSVQTQHYSPFTMELGAGFKFGNLQLDATLHPDFVHNGPYFISGENTSTMFPKVTATYTF